MKLNELMEKDVLIDTGEEKRTVTWEEGEVTFEVFVKKEMSIADHEFIYLNVGAHEEDKDKLSYMKRTVHRMVRLEDGPIPLETLTMMKPSLITAMCEVVKVPSPKANRSSKSSGTS